MSRSALSTGTGNNSHSPAVGNVEYFLMDEHGNEQADDGTREILSPIFPRRGSGDDTNTNNNGDEADNDLLLAQDNDERRSSLLLSPGSPPEGAASVGFRRHHHYRRRSSRHHHRSAAELSGRNILNAVTYGIHLACWWGVAVWGIDGLVPTHWRQTQQYETLITPATWNAHYLWVPILVTEAAFSLAQLFPHYRARPIVTGIGYRFFYTVLLQIAFTFLYSFGLFIGSFITAVLTLLALLSLLSAQHYHTVDNHARRRSSNSEYVLFKFPFFLHAGWMILMTVEHYSLLFRRYSTSPSLQLASDIVALGALLAVGALCLSYHASDFVIPTVILWSYVRVLLLYTFFVCASLLELLTKTLVLISTFDMHVSMFIRLALPADCTFPATRSW